MKTLIQIFTIIIILNNNALFAEEINTAESLPSVFSSNAVGPTAGITLGTPGVVNLEFGIIDENFGFELFMSGLTFLELALSGDDDSDDNVNSSDGENDPPIDWMFQLNFLIMAESKKDFFIAPSLLFGLVRVHNDDDGVINWVYGGISSQIYIKGFFLEIGITYGHDADRAYYGFNKYFAPIAQVGYLMRFSGN